MTPLAFKRFNNKHKIQSVEYTSSELITLRFAGGRFIEIALDWSYDDANFRFESDAEKVKRTRKRKNKQDPNKNYISSIDPILDTREIEGMTKIWGVEDLGDMLMLGRNKKPISNTYQFAKKKSIKSSSKKK